MMCDEKHNKIKITAGIMHIFISFIAVWHFFFVGSYDLRLPANYIWPALAVLFLFCALLYNKRIEFTIYDILIFVFILYVMVSLIINGNIFNRNFFELVLYILIAGAMVQVKKNNNLIFAFFYILSGVMLLIVFIQWIFPDFYINYIIELLPEDKWDRTVKFMNNNVFNGLFNQTNNTSLVLALGSISASLMIAKFKKTKILHAAILLLFLVGLFLTAKRVAIIGIIVLLILMAIILFKKARSSSIAILSTIILLGVFILFTVNTGLFTTNTYYSVNVRNDDYSIYKIKRVIINGEVKKELVDIFNSDIDVDKILEMTEKYKEESFSDVGEVNTYNPADVIPLEKSMGMVSKTESTFNDDDFLNGRVEIWKATISKILEKPLFGHGYSTTKLLIDRKSVHNTYLHMVAELGIVGFILFMIPLIMAYIAAIIAFWRILRRLDYPWNDRFWILGYSILIQSFTFGVGLAEGTFQNENWMLLFFICQFMGVWTSEIFKPIELKELKRKTRVEVED